MEDTASLRPQRKGKLSKSDQSWTQLWTRLKRFLTIYSESAMASLFQSVHRFMWVKVRQWHQQWIKCEREKNKKLRTTQKDFDHRRQSPKMKTKTNCFHSNLTHPVVWSLADTKLYVMLTFPWLTPPSYETSIHTLHCAVGGEPQLQLSIFLFAQFEMLHSRPNGPENSKPKMHVLDWTQCESSAILWTRFPQCVSLTPQFIMAKWQNIYRRLIY